MQAAAAAAAAVAAPLPAIANLQNGSIFVLSSSGNGGVGGGGGSSSTSPFQPQLSSSIALVMALLLSIVFVVGYLMLFLRQWVSVGGGVRLDGNGRSQFRGVDPDLVGRFPLFRYPGNCSSGSGGSSSVNSCSKGVTTECMVCLGDFEEGEVLLILPACRHAFHRPCIDLWLFSHRTCPLCRSSVLLLPPAKAAPDRDCSYGQTPVTLEMPPMAERVLARAPAAAEEEEVMERRNPSREFLSGSLRKVKDEEAVDGRNPKRGFLFRAVEEEAMERRNPSREFPSGSLTEDKDEAVDGRNPNWDFLFRAKEEEETTEGRSPNRGFPLGSPAEVVEEEEEAVNGRNPNWSFPSTKIALQLWKYHSTEHPSLPSELQYQASMADKSQNVHGISILSSPSSSSSEEEETMEGGNPNQGFPTTEIASKLWRSQSTGHPFPPSELRYQASMADISHNFHSISIFRPSSSSSEAMEGRNPNQGFPSTEIQSQLRKYHSTGLPFLPSKLEYEASTADKSQNFRSISIFRPSSSSSEAMEEGRNPNQGFPSMEIESQLQKSCPAGHPFLPSELKYEASTADKSQNFLSISIFSPSSSSSSSLDAMLGRKTPETGSVDGNGIRAMEISRSAGSSC